MRDPATIPGFRLKAVYNTKFGQWRIIHNQPCAKGDTSVIANVLCSLDHEEDGMLARHIVEVYNKAREAVEAGNGHT